MKLEPSMKINIVDVALSDSEEFVLIRGNEKSIVIDRHYIINNEDGWFDGFEMTWDEVYEACLKYQKG